MRIYVWEVVVAIVALPVVGTILWLVLILVMAPFMAIRKRKKSAAPPEGNAAL